MENKKSNGALVGFLVVIIAILSVLCILFATGTLKLDKKSNSNSNTEESNKKSEVTSNITSNQISNVTSNEPKSNTVSNTTSNTVTKKLKLSDYVGDWTNKNTQNVFTVKKVSDSEISFTWFLYRTANIEDKTIKLKDGKGIFFMEYGNKKFKKATIVLTDNGVNVVVEDVKSADSNYKLISDEGGFEYITAGTYKHESKTK
jgi:hypothetical protein